MFFQKKQSTENEDNVAKKSIKHMDAVVTWVILGSIVWSIYGVSKLSKKKWQEEDHTHLVEPKTEIKRKSFLARLFGR